MKTLMTKDEYRRRKKAREAAKESNATNGARVKFFVPRPPGEGKA